MKIPALCEECTRVTAVTSCTSLRARNGSGSGSSGNSSGGGSGKRYNRQCLSDLLSQLLLVQCIRRMIDERLW